MIAQKSMERIYLFTRCLLSRNGEYATAALTCALQVAGHMDKTLKADRPGSKLLLGHFWSCNLEQATFTIFSKLNK